MKLKKVLPLITFAALFGASTAASATCGTTACAGKIDTVYYTSNGTIYIGTNGDETSLNCTAVADVYVTLPSTNANQKAIYATVLTAKASDQKCRVANQRRNKQL